MAIGGDAAVEKRLAALAWDDRFRGRFTFVSVNKEEKLDAIDGAKGAPGVLLVEPGRFGVDGVAFAQTTGAEGLEEALVLALAKHKVVEKDTRSQVEAGHREGIDWKTEIPDTDPGPPGGK